MATAAHTHTQHEYSQRQLIVSFFVCPSHWLASHTQIKDAADDDTTKCLLTFHQLFNFSVD